MRWGSIYYGRPVNWGHPLNRGLAGWWLALPWWRGGMRWRDLCGKSHGLLTNGPVWKGAYSRPGGSGAVDFDGTNDIVTIANNNTLDITGSQISYGCWVYPRTSGSYQQLVGKSTND